MTINPNGALQPDLRRCAQPTLRHSEHLTSAVALPGPGFLTKPPHPSHETRTSSEALHVLCTAQHMQQTTPSHQILTNQLLAHEAFPKHRPLPAARYNRSRRSPPNAASVMAPGTLHQSPSLAPNAMHRRLSAPRLPKGLSNPNRPSRSTARLGHVFWLPPKLSIASTSEAGICRTDGELALAKMINSALRRMLRAHGPVVES